MNRSRRRVLAAMVAAASTGLAGCSSGEEKPTTETSETTTVTVTATDIRTSTSDSATSSTGPRSTEGTPATTTITTSHEIKLSNVRLHTSQLSSGGSVGIQFVITNPGESATTGTVTLEVGSKTATREVQLDAGEKATSFVNVLLEERGRYAVRVNGEIIDRVAIGNTAYRSFKYDAANSGRALGPLTTPRSMEPLLNTDEGVAPGSIVADEDTVFVALRGDPGIVAVDVATGDEQWRVATEGYVQNTPPVVADGTLYTLETPLDQSSKSGRIRARATDDGGLLWEYTQDSVTGASYLSGDLYVSSLAGEPKLTAIEDGSDAWSTTLTPPTDAGNVTGLSVPAVYNGTAFVTALTDQTGVVFAVNNGSRVWTTEVSGAGVSHPVVGESVYVRSLDGVHILGRPDGSLDYSDELSPASTYGFTQQPTPALADGVLYGCSRGDALQAADVRAGEQLWSVALEKSCASASPTVVDGTVVFQADDGTVFGYDVRDGSRQFALSLEGDRVETSPFVTGNHLIAATRTGVYSADAANKN